MSELHERFDALVATLEKTFNLNLGHVKDAPAAEPTAAAPAAAAESAPAPAESQAN